MQIQTSPSDYVTPETYVAEYCAGVITSAKMLNYYTLPLRDALLDCGAMAVVGRRTFFHKTLFWPCYQRLQQQHAQN